MNSDNILRILEQILEEIKTQLAAEYVKSNDNIGKERLKTLLTLNKKVTTIIMEGLR